MVANIGLGVPAFKGGVADPLVKIGEQRVQ